MRVVVPYAAGTPKTRLAPVLTPVERGAFARAMLADVVGAIRDAGREPSVLATAEVDVDAHTIVDERSLDTAVNEVLAETAAGADHEAAAVVMADLPLSTGRALRGVFEATGDLVVVPGRGGGTNAFLTRAPEFRTDYHGTSYLDHLRVAGEIGASVREVDSHRLSTDVDEPADLVEVLLLGDGAARDWLVDAGFEVVTDGTGRVGVERAD